MDTNKPQEDLKRLHRRNVHRDWVQRNLERRKAYMKKWYRDNAERMSRKFREWQKAHFNERKSYKIQWAKSHPESVKKSNRKQYFKNKTARYEYTKRHRLENKEHYQEYCRNYHKRTYPEKRFRLLIQTAQYAKAHPEVRRRAALNYKRRHPEKWKAQQKACRVRRRAKLRGADISDRFVNTTIRQWRKNKNFRCYYCSKVFPIKALHVDHIIPVSKGGNHSTDNICKACPKCNLTKQDKHIWDYPINGQPLLI